MDVHPPQNGTIGVNPRPYVRPNISKACCHSPAAPQALAAAAHASGRGAGRPRSRPRAGSHLGLAAGRGWGLGSWAVGGEGAREGNGSSAGHIKRVFAL